MKQGITTNKVDDTKDISRVQVKYLGITIDNAVIVEPKGSHTKLPKGTQCLVFSISQNQHFILPIENIKRPKDLESGERATGNFEKNSHIKFKNNGDVVINDGENNGIQYQATDTYIQSLVSQINAELTKIAGVLPAYSAIKSTIVIDTSPSKIDKLKVE